MRSRLFFDNDSYLRLPVRLRSDVVGNALAGRCWPGVLAAVHPRLGTPDSPSRCRCRRRDVISYECVPNERSVRRLSGRWSGSADRAHSRFDIPTVFHQSRAQVDSGDTAYSMARWGVSIRACPLPTDCTQASTRPVVNSVRSRGQGDLPVMNVASAFAISSAE